MGALKDVTLPHDIQRKIGLRQARNPIRKLHHHAFRCRNAEETRAFYEDVLGMPLIQTIIVDREFKDQHNNFCHFFFEIGDGSTLAFFDFPAVLENWDFSPTSGYDHHVALEVENDGVLDDFKQRLTAANVPYRYFDQDVYHSLYFHDPNGLNFELLTKGSTTDEYERKSAEVARRDVQLWMDHVHPDKQK